MRANFQKNYLMRYAALATVCLLMAAWFGYDGLVGYPAQLPAAAAFDQIKELDAAKRNERWKQITTDKNLPKETPKKTAEQLRSDIVGQYFWGGLNLLVGLPALILWLRSRGAWVESSDGGLTTSWGQTLQFSQVTLLDKKKWQRKGIAKATYSPGGGGQSKLFVFDDFKFEREPLGQMLRDLEQHLLPEQIVGGPPEAELESSPEDESKRGG